MKKPSRNKSSKDKTKRKSPDSGASPARRSAPSPTVKQRQYVAGRLAGKSKKQSALDAGYGPGMAKNPGQKIDAKPGVRKLLLEAFKEAGITPARLAKVALQGLQANVVHHKTQYSKREVHVDFKERREMLKLVGQFEGSLIEKHEIDAGPTLAEILEDSFRE